MATERAPVPPYEWCPATKVALVVNPRSGHGTTSRIWRRLEPYVRDAFGDYTLLETERPDHAAELVREALRNGHDRIVSAGGDGTHYEVVNGFFDGTAPVNSNAALALLPLGTANDYAKTLQLPRGARALSFLKSDRVVRADVGRLTSVGHDGAELRRHFLTATHIGLGAKVGAIANRSNKRLGGFLTFLWAVVSARLTSKSVLMEVTVDGTTYTERCLDAVVAKGQYDGGGIHIAPHAQLNNGLFDVYLIGDINLPDTVWNLHLLYRGKQDRHPKVTYMRGKRVTIRSESKPLVSPDGELAGMAPATIEVVPRAVPLVTGPNPPVI